MPFTNGKNIEAEMRNNYEKFRLVLEAIFDSPDFTTATSMWTKDIYQQIEDQVLPVVTDEDKLRTLKAAKDGMDLIGETTISGELATKITDLTNTINSGTV